jgi:hypothetical protein
LSAKVGNSRRTFGEECPPAYSCGFFIRARGMMLPLLSLETKVFQLTNLHCSTTASSRTLVLSARCSSARDVPSTPRPTPRCSSPCLLCSMNTKAITAVHPSPRHAASGAARAGAGQAHRRRAEVRRADPPRRHTPGPQPGPHLPCIPAAAAATAAEAAAAGSGPHGRRVVASRLRSAVVHRPNATNLCCFRRGCTLTENPEPRFRPGLGCAEFAPPTRLTCPCVQQGWWLLMSHADCARQPRNRVANPSGQNRRGRAAVAGPARARARVLV